MEAVDTLLTPTNGMASRIIAFFKVAPVILPVSIIGAAPKAYSAVLKFAQEVRREIGPTAKLGVAGFCWGGYGSTRLCGEKVDGRNLVDVQFNAHPSAVDGDMVVQAIKSGVPYSCAVAELDGRFTKAIAEEAEAKVKEEVEEGRCEFVVHEGCIHGFAVRAAEGTKSMEGYHAAAKQAVDWFNKYLK